MLTLEQSPIPLPTADQAQKVEQAAGAILFVRTVATTAIVLFARFRGWRTKGRKRMRRGKR